MLAGLGIWVYGAVGNGRADDTGQVAVASSLTDSRSYGDAKTEVEGDVIVYGDCAKSMLDKFPQAKYWGESDEYPNCTPIWSNISGVGMADYIRSLV